MCNTTADFTCPDRHRCCSAVECCVTDGCRGPTDIFYYATESASDSSARCDTCRDDVETEYFSSPMYQNYFFGEVTYTKDSDVSNLCQYRTSDDDQGTNSTGWYNTITQTECATTYGYPPTPPKCSMCTWYLEQALMRLHSQVTDGVCTSQVCEDVIAQSRSSCEEPISTCECFCSLAYPSFEACPHIMQQIDDMSVSDGADDAAEGQGGEGGGSDEGTQETNGGTYTTTAASGGMSRTWNRTILILLFNVSVLYYVMV